MKLNMRQKYMTLALNEAKKFKGKTGLNPAVGAVIIKNNQIISKGSHKYFGGPHAEIVAINKAKNSIANSDIYVTLEPCSHYGKTPPCCDVIIKKKFKNVIIGMIDPNPLVSEQGILKIKQAGINIFIENLNNKINKFYNDFTKYIKTGLPYFRLKTAISLDGKIALKNSYSKWITNDKCRKYVHRLRNSVDAILIGANTLNIDNPYLNIRYGLKPKENFIIILDSNLNIKSSSNIFKYHKPEKIIIITNSNDKDKINTFVSKKINIIKTSKNKNGELNIKPCLKQITEYGIKDILIEGGGKIYTYFLKNKLIDEAYFFVSNKIIGNDGIPVFTNLNLKKFDYFLNDITYKKFDDNMLINGKLN